MTTYTSVKTAPSVIILLTVAIVRRIAETGAIRALMLAKTKVSVNNHLILSSDATMTVAFGWTWPVALRLNPSVMTVVTWLIPFVMVSVTFGTQELRTRIGGVVKMIKSVSSRRLGVTGIQIVTLNNRATLAMNRIVPW